MLEEMVASYERIASIEENPRPQPYATRSLPGRQGSLYEEANHEDAALNFLPRAVAHHLPDNSATPVCPQMRNSGLSK